MSKKPVAFCRSGDAAGVGLAHPSVSPVREIIVDGIAKGTGHHDAEIEQRPVSGKLFQDFQGGGGFGEDTALIEEQNGFEVVGGKSEILQDLLGRLRLERRELESSVGVMMNRKVDPRIAPTADPVEYDDPFMLSPFMQRGIKAIDHS